MSLWGRLFGSQDVRTIEFEEESYPVFSQQKSFFDECRITGKAACRVKYANYWNVLRVGYDQGILDGNAKVVCEGCNLAPPFAFVMALETEQSPSTKCPRCGSARGFILWHSDTGGMGSVIGKGDIDTVKLLLKRGMSVDEPGGDGQTALMHAADLGKFEIFELLLREGADPDYRNELGLTPLIAAMSVNTDPQIVRALLDRGVAIDLQTRKGWSALMWAARWRHVEVVRDLIDKGAALDLQNKDGRTALLIALENMGTDVATVLIDAGAAVDVQDKEGWSALMLAVDYGYVDVITSLLDKGADPNLQSRAERDGTPELRVSGGAGQTALTLAAENAPNIGESEVKEIIDALLDAGAQVDHQTSKRWSALSIAVYNGYTDIIMRLLAHGAAAGPEAKVGGGLLVRSIFRGQGDVTRALLERGAEINRPSEDGWTPLLAAASEGMTDLVALLLDRGARLDHRNKHGRTAIGLATSKGHAEIFTLLAERGAEINLREEDGVNVLLFAAEHGHAAFVTRVLAGPGAAEMQTEDSARALRIAAAAGHGDIVAVLIDNGIPLDMPDEEGYPALIYAANAGHTDIVTTLLERGVALDAQSNDDWTALILAAARGHPGTVATLLQRGAAVDKHTIDGVTALINAAANGHREIVGMLLDSNAALDMATKDNWTALTHATENGHSEIVGLLLERGADPNGQNIYGESALMIAALQGNSDIVQALLDHGARMDLEDAEGRTARVRAETEGHDNIAALLATASAGDSAPPEPDQPRDQEPYSDQAPMESAVATVLQTDAGDHGHYLKRLFDHVRDGFYGSSFTYDDLPPAPVGSAGASAFDEDNSIEVVTVGAEAEHAISPFLQELEGVGFIESVAPMTFALTPTGRVSSIVVESTDTSGYLVFDYHEMDTAYGVQVFQAIRDAMQGATGTCSFYDGDVSSSVLSDMLPHVARLVPAPARQEVLSGGTVVGVGPYIVAVWSDKDDTFTQLHANLMRALPNAYAGYMTLGATHRREDFERAVSQQLSLTPATEFISGRATPGTEKYLA